MAYYTNRAGRTVELDPNDRLVKQRIESKEIFLKEVTQKVVAPVKQEEVEIKSDAPTKKELQEKYVAKFGKKPFGGWDEVTLIEKLA